MLWLISFHSHSLPFPRLYGDPNNRPKYNLVFVLSGGGKFNYFGTKGLLELDLEDAPLLSSAEYVLCLDSLLNPEAAGDLYLHVSKPPKEGSKAYHFVQALNQVSSLDPRPSDLCIPMEGLVHNDHVG